MTEPTTSTETPRRALARSLRELSRRGCARPRTRCGLRPALARGITTVSLPPGALAGANDLPNGSSEYAYDANGNMASDSGRGVYMHLSEVNKDIKIGDYVKEGQVIGAIGMSAYGKQNGGASHLHYELSINGKKVNPHNPDKSMKDPQKFLDNKMYFAPMLKDVIIETKAPEIKIPRVIIHTDQNAPSKTILLMHHN